jgi:hypothetical protein
LGRQGHRLDRGERRHVAAGCPGGEGGGGGVIRKMIKIINRETVAGTGLILVMLLTLVFF